MEAVMLLVVDVGNTGTVMGVVEGDRILGRWEVMTADRTADEWVLVIRSMIRQSGLAPTAAALASVVPDATRVLRSALPQVCGSEPVVVGAGVKTGMAIDLDNAREVGADRVAGAVGAVDRYGAPVITVDFGTATTIDLIDADAHFRGGAIAVGVKIAAEALVRSTSALRRVELSTPSAPVGKSTVEAVQSGTVFGFAGLVDGLVGRFLEGSEGSTPTVVATGGFAQLVAPHCATVDVIDPDLTLWGLALIHRRNT
jgi:type III pantothenate kinase